MSGPRPVRILLSTIFWPDFVARLAKRHDLITVTAPITVDTLPAASDRAEVLLTVGSSETSARLIDSMPALGLIACYGSGYEGVDVAYAVSRGIAVCHSPGPNATSVAELAMALLLACSRRLVANDGLVRAGEWHGHPSERFLLTRSVSGRRLGIYGLGHVGRRIADRARAFEMEIGYHGRAARPDVPFAYFSTLRDLAGWSEYLVISTRATLGNRHAVDARVLAALGPHGVVVNVGRGSIIDEMALIDSLERGEIAAAGLDVYEREPHVPERLLIMPNVVLSPHMGSKTTDAQRAQQDLVMENIERYSRGEPLLTPVPVSP